MSTYVERLIQAVKDGRVQLDDIVEPTLYYQVKRKVTNRSQKKLINNKDGLTINQLSEILDRSPSSIFGQIKRMGKDYCVGSVKTGTNYARAYHKDVLAILKNIKNGKKRRSAYSN